MKIGNKEVKDLPDDLLIAAYNNYQAVIRDRNDALKHDKFNKDRKDGDKTIKKLENPEVNPVFTELLNEVKSELNKRKINV